MWNNITALALALNQCDRCEQWVLESLTSDYTGDGEVCTDCYDQSVEDTHEWREFCHEHRRGGYLG